MKLQYGGGGGSHALNGVCPRGSTVCRPCFTPIITRATLVGFHANPLLLGLGRPQRCHRRANGAGVKGSAIGSNVCLGGVVSKH